jgi:glutamate racemase
MVHFRLHVKPRAIGIFDSGLGGFSILRALLSEMPSESFDYVSDSIHAPYGERPPEFILDRSLACSRHLIENLNCKALVVACNSATAASIASIRLRWPDVPIVGVEPPLRPAAELSKSGRIAVMATKATLASSKFATLASQISRDIVIYRVPCDGLALSIERGDFDQAHDLARECLTRFVGGAETLGRVDCIALGCTHYPLGSRAIAKAAPHARLLDPSTGAARRCKSLLQEIGALEDQCSKGTVSFHGSGDMPSLRNGAALHLAGLAKNAQFISWSA